MERVLLLLHVVGGFTSLLSGLVVASLPNKGNRLHKRLGYVFLYGMITVFTTAVLLLVLVKWNIFLFAIAVMTFYMNYAGFRSIRLKNVPKPALLDWIISILTMLCGVGILIYGINLFVVFSAFHPLAFLCLVFGIGMTHSAQSDIRLKNRKSRPKTWWISQHIGMMMGALIASSTAFAVNNLGSLIPNPQFGWLLWLLPTVVGVPFIIYHISRIRRQPKSLITQ